ncbi:MAG TPA: SOS response-associated peptidase, partial [Chitinophagaceae bacterium]|nr:SOS response-associated peptidase [Chitinophagaceae bacterium]
MCYDVASGIRSALKYAKHRSDDPAMIASLEIQLELWLTSNVAYYQISGYAYPPLLVFTNDQPFKPQFFQWGLIPHWVQSKVIANTIRNQTLNARAETIFEKPSFKNSAKYKRCLIYIDAFYEYHHANKKVYPFHISLKLDEPIILAGLWDEWLDTETGELIQTVSIVTTKANEVMSQIHNNPKLIEPRMPAILGRDKQNEWLKPIDHEDEIFKLLHLLEPIESNLLKYHTVRRLKGKESVGNTKEAELEYIYPELLLKVEV